MDKDIIREVKRNLLIHVSNYEYHSGWSYYMTISYIDRQIFVKDSCKYIYIILDCSFDPWSLVGSKLIINIWLINEIN